MVARLRVCRRRVSSFLLLGVLLWLPPSVRAAVADLDGDGRIAAGDVFLFASCWMTSSATADLVLSGTVDDADLLELVRQFHGRGLLPTPTPSGGPLPAPVWTHPEASGTYLLVQAIDDPMFLDWSDVQGAAAYEVVAHATNLEGQFPRSDTWLVQATQTPGVPVSYSVYSDKLVWTSHDRAVAQVRALPAGPTPLPGKFSEQITFFLLLATETPTPTPTIRPTVDIDFNGDTVTNGWDLLYVQRSWLTRLGEQPHYDPAVASLAESTIEVDANDVLAVAREYHRQRDPLPIPRLVSPAPGAVFSASEFLTIGLTYDWDPVPDQFGGIKYTLWVQGPEGSPSNMRTEIHNILDSELTKLIPYFDIDMPRNQYRWTVQAVSRYGIKIESPWAPSNVFYVDQSW